jgi:hypothetical protein
VNGRLIKLAFLTCYLTALVCFDQKAQVLFYIKPAVRLFKVSRQ